MSAPKPITEHLADLLRERSARGLEKYGTSIDRGDLNRAEWLQHLLEELLDAAQYVEAAKRQAAAAPPHGYAYRYPGPYGGIRFNGGEEVNGSRPIEAVPYWLGSPPAPQPQPRPQAEPVARPLSEWCEDFGPVTWWKLPVEEAAWIGTPNDDDWPGYHTHWTPHPAVPEVPQ
jgi:hypothetical protein